MKKTLLIISIIILVFGNISALAQEVNFRDPQTWLLGYCSPDDLLQEPHYIWYDKEFDSYLIDKEAFIEFTQFNLLEIEVLIVLGTWCPDSRREVPRFMKLMQLAGLDQGKISILGTDSYKEAPIDNYEALDIDRVPTFIFYHKKNEIGRIIEYPVASLERDMVNIFKETLKK